MEIDDVVDELHEAANNLGILAPNFGTSKGKAYEVWIMLEIVVRLMRRGVDVYPHDCDDEIEPYFRVSGSPADMPAKGPNGKAPCHFKLVKNQRLFELHLGLNMEGLSTATHEIDLSVLNLPQAYALRLAGGGPFDGHVSVGLELKAHSDEYKLSHDIPRALLGVALDLDPTWAIHSWTFHTVGDGSRRMTRTARMELALLTTTQLHVSSETLLMHHGAGAHSLVCPGGNEAAIDEIVGRIEALFD